MIVVDAKYPFVTPFITSAVVGGYLKRETEEPATASPAPRRKKSEKQMARDDLKALLADD